MQTLLFGLADDAVHIRMKSNAIRLAYLVSNELKLAGNLHDYAGYEEGMKSMSMIDKVKFVMQYDKELTDEQRAVFEEMEKVLKFTGKIKHRNKELIVLMKQAEAALNTHFEYLLEEGVQVFKDAGLIELGKLDGKPGYAFYPVFAQDTEMKHQDVCLFSEILQMKLDEEDINLPTTLLLNYPFFFEDGFEKDYNIAIPRDNEFTDYGFLSPILNFYTLTPFTVADIDTLKMELKAPLQILQQEFDRFIALKTNPEAAYDYLHKNIKSASQNFINAFDSTILIKNYKEAALKGIQPYQLYAGMLPWKTIYGYFKFINMVRGKTLKIMDNFNPPSEWMPVLIIKLPAEAYHPQPIQQQEDQLHGLKKSLEL